MSARSGVRPFLPGGRSNTTFCVKAPWLISIFTLPKPAPTRSSRSLVVPDILDIIEKLPKSSFFPFTEEAVSADDFTLLVGADVVEEDDDCANTGATGPKTKLQVTKKTTDFLSPRSNDGRTKLKIND